MTRVPFWPILFDDIIVDAAGRASADIAHIVCRFMFGT
jgi:hypothetical protein